MEKNSEGIGDITVKLQNVSVEFIGNIDRRLSAIESRADTLEKVFQKYSKGWL